MYYFASRLFLHFHQFFSSANFINSFLRHMGYTVDNLYPKRKKKITKREVETNNHYYYIAHKQNFIFFLIVKKEFNFIILFIKELILWLHQLGECKTIL